MHGVRPSDVIQDLEGRLRAFSTTSPLPYSGSYQSASQMRHCCCPARKISHQIFFREWTLFCAHCISTMPCLDSFITVANAVCTSYEQNCSTRSLDAQGVLQHLSLVNLHGEKSRDCRHLKSRRCVSMPAEHHGSTIRLLRNAFTDCALHAINSRIRLQPYQASCLSCWWTEMCRLGRSYDHCKMLRVPERRAFVGFSMFHGSGPMAVTCQTPCDQPDCGLNQEIKAAPKSRDSSTPSLSLSIV